MLVEINNYQEYRNALDSRNFENVVGLLITVGKCKKELEKIEPEDVKFEKEKLWRERIQKKFEVLCEDAGVFRLIGFNGNKGSYFYEVDIKKHRVFQVTSQSYFLTFGVRGKRELPMDVAFDLAENHLPFAVLSASSSKNEIAMMMNARLKADKILNNILTSY